jgi:hypothetical protein
MPDAARNYSSYASGEFRWMLARFIVPVIRLAEFETAAAGVPNSPWRLSALLGLDLDIVADIAKILDFNRRHDAANIAISSVELKASAPADILSAHSQIPRDLSAFFEIPLSGDLRTCLSTLAQCGRYAKVRTGGEAPEMIPAVESVAQFLQLCTEFGLPFKATAGLHHPIRSTHGLTYAADSPSATMHGFFNVFLASVFLRNNAIPLAKVIEVLNETSPLAFTFSADHIGWRSHSLTREQIVSARQHFSLSFGSCSFSEPVEDLQALSLL